MKCTSVPAPVPAPRPLGPSVPRPLGSTLLSCHRGATGHRGCQQLRAPGAALLLPLKPQKATVS